MPEAEGGEPIHLELADALELYANKRLALVAMLTFLELNGYRAEASDPDLADWILSFGAGATPQQLAPPVRAGMRPVP